MTGPITGDAGIAESCRWCSATKSPLTDTMHDCQSRGKFGPELMFAGFDYIVIEDISKKQVYLWMHGGKAELRDVINMWGKDVWTTTELIQEEHAAEVGRGAVKQIKVAG